jgi:hypothetical protein
LRKCERIHALGVLGGERSSGEEVRREGTAEKRMLPVRVCEEDGEEGIVGEWSEILCRRSRKRLSGMAVWGK